MSQVNKRGDGDQVDVADIELEESVSNKDNDLEVKMEFPSNNM